MKDFALGKKSSDDTHTKEKEQGNYKQKLSLCLPQK